MKKFIAIVVLGIMLTTTGTAHAGDAWPWVVGGLAGAALLTAATHNNYPTTNVVYAPAYYPSTTAYPVSYSTQTWVPGYYDVYGIWHGGYYASNGYCGTSSVIYTY